MSEPISEYELKEYDVSGGGSDDIVTESYAVSYDEERDEVIVDSKTDDFTGVVQCIDVGDGGYRPCEHAEQVSELLDELRDFESDNGDIIEHYSDAVCLETVNLPVETVYIIDHGSVGVRVRTEVSGEVYCFETVVSRDAISKIVPSTFEKHLLQHTGFLAEAIIEDHVIGNVTLDGVTDDE